MPRTWKLERKGFKFMIKPDAGKDYDLSIPLLPVLRDLLEVVSTAKEARFVVNQEKVLINQKPAKRTQQTIGLFDTLSFADEHYRLTINEKNNLYLEKITAAEAKTTFSKVLDKKIMKGGKVQLNLLNGYNVTVDKDNYKVGDSVELSLPKMTVKGKKELKKGGQVLIFRGKHPGVKGTIESIKEGGITIKADKKHISTLDDYAIAI